MFRKRTIVASCLSLLALGTSTSVSAYAADPPAAQAADKPLSVRVNEALVAAQVADEMPESILTMREPAPNEDAEEADPPNGEVPHFGPPDDSTDPVDLQVGFNSSRPSASIRSDDQVATLTLITGSDASVDSAPVGGGRAFGAVAPRTDALVRPLAVGSAQILAIMRDSSAPNWQRYELDLPPQIAAVVPSGGGGFLLRGWDGQIRGVIAAPWAKDATGALLPTKYVLEGRTITQITDTTNATFPVVADPRFTYGKGGIYLNATGRELKAVAIGLASLLAVPSAACAATVYIKTPATAALAGFLCGSGVVKSLTEVKEIIVALVKFKPFKDGFCYQTRIVDRRLNRVRPHVVTVRPKGNCKP